MPHPLQKRYIFIEQDIRSMFTSMSAQLESLIEDYGDADGNIPYFKREELRSAVRDVVRSYFVVYLAADSDTLEQELEHLTELISIGQVELSEAQDESDRRRTSARLAQITQRFTLAQRGLVVRSINAETGAGYTPFARLLMRHITAVIEQNVDAARAMIERAFASRPDVLQWLQNASPKSGTQLGDNL